MEFRPTRTLYGQASPSPQQTRLSWWVDSTFHTHTDFGPLMGCVFTGATTMAAGSSYTLTVTGTDPYGNDVPCQSPSLAPWIFTVLWAGDAVSPTWSCTADARYQAVFTPGTTTVGTYTADLMVNGLPQTRQPAINVAVTAAAASATRCGFTGATTMVAGSSYTLTVTGSDSSGNSVPCQSPTQAAGLFTVVWAGAAVASPAWSCTAGTPARYQAVFTPGTTTMGTYTADLRVSGVAQTSQAAINVAVTAAPASPAKCVFSGATTMVAGSSYTLTVTGTDPYGNSVPCQSPTQAASIFTVVWAGAAIGSPTWSCTASARYQAVFTPGTTTMGTYTADLKVYNVAQTKQPAINVAVTAAPASATKCTFSGATTMTAGSSYTLTVTGTDPYGNSVPCSGATLALGAFTVVWAGAAIGSPTWSCTADSRYQAVFTPGTTTVGTYTADLKVYNVPQTIQTALSVAVTAAPASAARCGFTGATTMVAGSSYTLTVTGTDPYGNSVPCQSPTQAAGIFTVVWAGAAVSPTWSCTAARYQALFTPGTTTMGTYTADLRVSGVAQTSQPAISVAVTAAPASPAKCVFSGAASMIAGSSYTLTVTGTDPYDNSVPCQSPSQAASIFTVVWAGAAVASPTWSCTADSPARYQAVFTPGTTTVGTYTADLKVYSLPQTRQPVINVAVTAAPASATKCVFSGATTMIAGSSYTLTVTGTDPYGNSVPCSGTTLLLMPSDAFRLHLPRIVIVCSMSFQRLWLVVLSARPQALGAFTVVWAGAAVASPTWSCTADSPARYQAVFTPGTTTVGTYTADLRVYNVPQTKQPAINVAVTAAPASPAKCVFSGATTMIAGSSYTLTVTGTDPYDNSVPCQSPSQAAGIFTVVWAGATVAPTWSCTAGTPARYQAVFTPGTTTVGTYTADLRVYSLTQTRQPAINVAVTPAPPSASKCVFTGATTLVAGEAYTMTVTGTDPYDNNVPCQSPSQVRLPVVCL
ncbi:hypothetical protein PAPYR_4498 [Paratrimastix pyriformis]|uniref:Uncharacterized protein n=1 Tax=Paratrimastix pyriformis TaxID=342808 RepID=A0ABQ8UP13_9EUKA|nr:hypothetical protein PAPYR_4498 [Paratrimastix pyriformis]